MLNTILHGDCQKVLPGMDAGSVDFILTDPPYLVNFKSRDGRAVPNDNNDAWLKPAFAEMHRVLANNSFAVSFYGWPEADKFIQAFRLAGFRIVGHFDVSETLYIEHPVFALPARVRIPVGEGVSRLPGRSTWGCYRLDILRQQAASHAETAFRSLAAHRDILEAGAVGTGPVRRLRLDAGCGKDVG